MSTHYETLSPTNAYRDTFGVALPLETTERHMWPRKIGHFIRAVPLALPAPDAAADSDTAPAREVVAAQWGLVPHWVKSASDAKLRSPKLIHAKAQGRNQVVSYAYVAQVCHTPLADNSAPNQHSLATPKAAAC